MTKTQQGNGVVQLKRRAYEVSSSLPKQSPAERHAAAQFKHDFNKLSTQKQIQTAAKVRQFALLCNTIAILNDLFEEVDQLERPERGEVAAEEVDATTEAESGSKSESAEVKGEEMCAAEGWLDRLPKMTLQFSLPSTTKLAVVTGLTSLLSLPSVAGAANSTAIVDAAPFAMITDVVPGLTYGTLINLGAIAIPLLLCWQAKQVVEKQADAVKRESDRASDAEMAVRGMVGDSVEAVRPLSKVTLSLAACWDAFNSTATRINLPRDFAWPLLDMLLPNLFNPCPKDEVAPIAWSVLYNTVIIGGIPLVIGTVMLLKKHHERSAIPVNSDEESARREELAADGQAALRAGIGALLGEPFWLIPFVGACLSNTSLSAAGFLAVPLVGLCEGFIQALCNELPDTIEHVKQGADSAGVKLLKGVGISTGIWLIASNAGALWQASWAVQGMSFVALGPTDEMETTAIKVVVMVGTSAILSATVGVGNALAGAVAPMVRLGPDSYFKELRVSYGDKLPDSAEALLRRSADGLSPLGTTHARVIDEARIADRRLSRRTHFRSRRTSDLSGLVFSETRPASARVTQRRGKGEFDLSAATTTPRRNSLPADSLRAGFMSYARSTDRHGGAALAAHSGSVERDDGGRILLPGAGVAGRDEAGRDEAGRGEASYDGASGTAITSCL